MRNSKAMRRKARQTLQRYKYYTPEELEKVEEEEKKVWDDVEVNEEPIVRIPRRKLDWDDD